MNTGKIEVFLERIAQNSLTGNMARVLRAAFIYPRYWFQYLSARDGYRKYGKSYKNNLIFVAGLPKSGTTWLEQVLASYKGYSDIYPPEIYRYEKKYGDRLDFLLPDTFFEKYNGTLSVIKTHIRGMPRNTTLLMNSGIRYVILYRDLRDVAVSYYFFVRSRPWHPEYGHYHSLSPSEGLHVFADRTLMFYADWIREWRSNRDSQLSVEVRYEDMLAMPLQTFSMILSHLELDSRREKILPILEKFNLKNKGESQNMHFRKGMAGDWKNHMDGGLKEVYREKIGDLLMELGYEKDSFW